MTTSVQDIAPCLAQGPLAASGTALVAATDALGESDFASFFRAFCVVSLFDGVERIVAGEEEPMSAAATLMDRLREWLSSGVATELAEVLAGRTTPVETATDVEKKTGDHYGKLFREFDADSYWKEPTDLLRTRLVRNDIDPARFAGQSVLDAGCGGGRYTVAWKLLGAGSVTGMDISAPGLADARKRIELAEIDGVDFREGNMLDLPLSDDEFDVVFSNGVLHHSRDWRRGIDELLRVLKPGGFGWLYLIEEPGGLFWDSIEILRAVMRSEESAVARRCLTAIGVPPNRRFYMLDHVMVPINVRLTLEQINTALEEAGAKEVRRLERGADFDRVEHIYQQTPHAVAKFGVGENRFAFTK